ncbi:MAG: hypothetical protein LKJ17_10705 [Oscillospiraceae bacterium]|jgi:hypothetical protein|nr:hypothetical protein [Oscillospiraceae bacterium]
MYYRNNNDREKLIPVHSQKLLKVLNDNKCIGLLKKVVVCKDGKPLYLFSPKIDVADIVTKFETEYGQDNIALDNKEVWENYSEQFFNKGQKLYSVTNYNAVNRIIENGYGIYLIGTYWNAKRKKKIYVFVYNNEIIKINEDQKEKSRKEYAEKHKDD